MRRILSILLAVLLLCLTVGAYASDMGTFEVFENQRYEQIDENSHRLIYDVYEKTEGESSGEGAEDPANKVFVETRTETESHALENGFCSACGYCAHSAVNEYDSPEVTKAEFTSPAEHHVWVTVYHIRECIACGLEISRDLTESYEYDSEHWYNEGSSVCLDCGYENTCDHSYPAEERELVLDMECKPLDAATHAVHKKTVMETVCSNCKQRLAYSEDEDYTDTVESHDWDADDTCRACGAKNNCAHTVTADQDTELGRDYVILDPQQHQLIKTFRTDKYCMTCGKQVSEGASTFQVIFEEGHHYENGVCWCGRPAVEGTCSHPDTHEETIDEMAACVRIDDSTHRIDLHPSTRVVCSVCGTVLSETQGAVYSETAAHEYSGGVCVCGQINPCAHPDPLATRTDRYIPNPGTPLNDSQHHVKYELYDCHYCAICGEDLAWSNHRAVEADENHEFDGGICSVCGYEQPVIIYDAVPSKSDSAVVFPTVPAVTASAPAKVPPQAVSAEPEVKTITFEPETEAEELRGVAVADNVPAAEALTALGDSLEAEEEKGAVIEIANLDLVLDKAEIEAMEELPMREQLMVVFFALSGAEAEEGTLSEEAVALVENITKRIASMTADEKKAFEALLTRTFPVETIEIDGVSYDFFVIVVEIEKDGVTAAERYGFRKDENDQWVLTSLNAGILD